MKNAIILGMLLLSTHSLAQFERDMTFGNTLDQFDAGQIYFDFGPNYSFVRQDNFWDGGTFYDSRFDLSWNSLDDDEPPEEEEPMDEIVVIGIRERQNLTSLWAQLTIGNWFGGTECTMYSDGGHCLIREPIIGDPDSFPLDPRCQTVKGVTPPLTMAQAEEYNLAAMQNEHFVNSLISTGAALGAAYLTSGASLTTQLLATGTIGLGSLIAGMPDASSFQFDENDVLEYTLEACNNANGGVDSTLSLTIR